MFRATCKSLMLSVLNFIDVVKFDVTILRKKLKNSCDLTNEYIKKKVTVYSYKKNSTINDKITSEYNIYLLLFCN